MSNEEKCDGCEDEMIICYGYQSAGYDAGLNWQYHDTYGLHCSVFVFDKEGRLIVY